MKTALVALAMLAGFALPAHAAGINLSWDDCSPAGTSNKTFACNTNVGAPFVLVGSFVAPAGTTAITGMEVDMVIGSVERSISDWWSFTNSGTCRQTALTLSTDFTAGDYFMCADYWAGQGQGVIAAYTTPYSAFTCRARLQLVVAIPPSLAAPVEYEQEYYAFRLAIDRTRTVGTGACAGCVAPAAILLNEIKLTQPVGTGDYRLPNPANRNFVTWQGGDPWQSCLFVPTRNTTWGAIKAQYR